MSPDRRLPIAEIVAATGLVLVGVAVLLASLSLPPPRFDPLGSAFVPRAIAASVVVLALCVLAGAFLRLRRAAPATAEAPIHRRRPDLALFTFGAAVAYVAALSSRLVDYGLATAIFILVVALSLTGLSRRAVVVAGLIALVLGFGGDALFTRVFYIDLP